MIWTQLAGARSRAIGRAGSRRGVASLTVLGIMVAASVVSGSPSAASAADPTFPTWAQVQAAQSSAAAKAAEIKKLTGLIGTLQAQAAAAGKVALQAGEAYLEANNALTTATATASKLAAQAKVAKAKAIASSREAGQLAAQLARAGHGDVSLQLLLNQRSSGDLLDALGTMSKLSATSASIFAAAEVDQKTADALKDQATVAKSARSTMAAKAKSTLAAANAAAAASTSKVNAQTPQQSILTAQLASLNGTSASTEAAYVAGVAWEAKQAAGTKPPPVVTPPGPQPGAPTSSKVSVAIAFAEAQLGKPYVIDGAGPNGWDCSGLTLKAYAAAGVYIGIHGTNSQYSTMASENRLVPYSARQPGDLLWYSDGGSTSVNKYHVTLYIGNNQMIEAPYPGVNVRIAAVRLGDLVPLVGRPTG
jgi:cell wall-associated NlpC family hydrolase